MSVTWVQCWSSALHRITALPFSLILAQPAPSLPAFIVDNTGSGQGKRSGADNKRLNSGYILKVESTRFPEVEYEKKRTAVRISAWTNWKES